MNNENREMPFGPPLIDDVTAKEYERAYKSLQEFLNLDPSQIQSFEDLSAELSLVGEDLKKIVVAGGYLQETNFGYQHPDGTDRKAVHKAWVVRKEVGDHHIFATTNDDRTWVTTYKIINGEQLSDFNYWLPVGDIEADKDPIFNIFAVDWRGKKVESYYPAAGSSSPQVLQNFVKIVQDGVRDILSVVDDPSDEPPLQLD